MEESLIVPPEKLSEEVLVNIVKEFVLREGTDYGAQEMTLDTKIQHVMSQIKKKKLDYKLRNF